MAVEFENECVGCPPELGCLGSACPNRNVAHLYCDKCNEEVDKLYEFEGQELCKDCVADNADRVLCSECDADTVLYEYEGEFYCIDCLVEKLTEV